MERHRWGLLVGVCCLKWQQCGAEQAFLSVEAAVGSSAVQEVEVMYRALCTVTHQDVAGASLKYLYRSMMLPLPPCRLLPGHDQQL
jgi:hypothetical protein